MCWFDETKGEAIEKATRELREQLAAVTEERDRYERSADYWMAVAQTNGVKPEGLQAIIAEQFELWRQIAKEFCPDFKEGDSLLESLRAEFASKQEEISDVRERAEWMERERDTARAAKKQGRRECWDDMSPHCTELSISDVVNQCRNFWTTRQHPCTYDRCPLVMLPREGQDAGNPVR